jgi:predicted nuclease of restriction endonuclease-like (RecB) superfamily
MVAKRLEQSKTVSGTPMVAGYESVLHGVVALLESARRASTRTVNTIMTATYWEVGKRIQEHEQQGKGRAAYGDALLDQLAADLTARLGRGFGRENLRLMRLFFQKYPVRDISQTVSGDLADSPISQTASGKSHQPATTLANLWSIADRFRLPWSHYVRLLSIRNPHARQFYEAEAIRGGWSVRQLSRQIDSQFYERTALSKNKTALLRKGQKSLPEDETTAEQEIKDPLVLEFLDLKDEYSEHDLEEALIHRLETFLLELGSDFAFVGRQKRLRIDNEWFRVDLLFFHRRLRCLVIIDLKLGRFTHADAGQMHMYLNYAREHWTNPGENPPVGLILCQEKREAVAHYSLEGLPNKVVAAEYRTALPKESALAAEIDKTRVELERRRKLPGRVRKPRKD